MASMAPERRQIAEIALKADRPQVFQIGQVREIAEAFLPQELGAEAGMALFLDRSVAGGKLGDEGDGGQEFMIERIIEGPFAEKIDVVKAALAVAPIRRNMLPRAAAADAETRLVVVVHVQHFLARETNRV